MKFPIDIRGMGIVTPFGFNIHEAVSKIFEQSDLFDFKQPHSLEKLRIHDYLSPHQQDMPAIRYMDNISKNAIVAADGCLSDAGFSDDNIHEKSYRFGVIIATSRGPCHTRRKLLTTFRNRNQQSVSATLFSNCGYNITSSLVAGFYGLRGANFTIAGGDNVAYSSMERGRVLLEKGFSDYVLIGYADSDPSIKCDEGLISMADFSCLFLVSKAGSVRPETPSMRLETVDEESVRKLCVWKEEPKIGSVYGAKKNADKKNQGFLLEEIKLSINSQIVEKRCYLPFIHLAFLWRNVPLRSTWEFWLLPIDSNRGISYWKINCN